MKHNRCITRKVLFGVLFFILLGLPACSPSIGLDQTAGVRATWTPAVHPTDQPYEVNTDDLSYFEGIPVLVIFDGKDPDGLSSLQVVNISTDDDYDVSSIIPASANTWSRPVVAENKDVYFQVGGTLYILSPGGQTHSIELPYNEENPAYCNWSWKGVLVCLNDALTAGFLVDQELNVVEMKLPADGGDSSGPYHEPYRVGENSMRTNQAITKTVNGRETVFYKDLDLETLTVQTQQVRIEQDFNRSIYGSAGSEYTQEGGNLDVIGISDDGEKIYLCSSVTDLADKVTTTKLWIETYDTSTLELIPVEFEVNPDVTRMFYRNHLIVSLLFDEYGYTFEKFAIIDLESGEVLEEISDLRFFSGDITAIFPYAEYWFFGRSYWLGYHRGEGELITNYFFTEEVYEVIEADTFYTVSQPIEP